MINLTEKGLPTAVEVGGQVFFINTDFRLWLTFPERINNLVNDDTGYIELFVEDIPLPTHEVIDVLEQFYLGEEQLDRGGKSLDRAENLIDLKIDADYIFAAFIQCYRLDLTECDLHWYKFQALMKALPDSATITQIMSIRGYKGDDKEMLAEKEKWALPLTFTEEEKAAIEEFNSIF